MRILPFLIGLFLCNHLFAQDVYWKARLTTGQYGAMDVNFILKNKNGFLAGSTAPDAHKRIIGGIKGSLAKSMFQAEGSLMEIDSLQWNGERFTGYLLMEKLKYNIAGVKQNGNIYAELTGRIPGRKYGKLAAIEVATLVKPKNYEQLWQEIAALTEKNIYNKAVLQTEAWKNFKKYMSAFAPLAMDDAEFCYAFFYNSKDLPFTHYAIQGAKNPQDSFSLPGMKGPESSLFPSLTTIDGHTMLLDVPAFNFRTQGIDTIMERIVATQPQKLIIDLRKNTGGDMEGGMRIAQFLTGKTLYGGVMLSQSYWNTHTASPAVSDYKNFKVMNQANYAWFREQVNAGVEGLSLVVDPIGKFYKGRVYILTSNSTASASEPFVYTLQKEGIATVVGAQTAGAVISMEFFPLRNLALTIPMLDYYTFDGKRLDKVGVTPDIVCDPKDALNVAISQPN